MTADDSSAETRSWAVIGRAKGLVMARRQCVGDEAMLLMTRAASSHEMSLQQLAECIVADHGLGWLHDVPIAARVSSRDVSVGVQVVKLEGGTADAWVVQAASPPAAHRVHFDFEGRRWSEQYHYAEGRTALSEVHGELPVMVYTATREED